MSEQREIAVLKRLTDVLDALGIPYAIGGSIASSMYGTVRFTRDADIGVLPFAPAADRFYRHAQRRILYRRADDAAGPHL